MVSAYFRTILILAQYVGKFNLNSFKILYNFLRANLTNMISSVMTTGRAGGLR